MKDSKKKDIIELYVRDLYDSYKVMCRTAAILDLTDEEEDIIKKGLKDADALIKKICACETLEEINKYIDVKKIIKNYKEVYKTRKRELYVEDICSN